MQYNYSFEIASVVLMAMLVFVVIIQPNFELAKGRSFFAFLLASLFESIFNVVSSWGLAHTDIVSNTANWWICFCFFLAEAFTSVLYFRYVVNLCEASRTKRTIYAKLTLIPYGIFLFMIVTTNWLHLIFDVEDNVYYQGIASWYGYAYIELFLLAGLLISITAKKSIRGRNRYSVFLATCISLCGIVFQSFNKTILLTGFSNAIVLFMFYIMIQNPNEYKDKLTGVSNERAFFTHFENMRNQDKPMFILVLDVHQPSILTSASHYRNSRELLSEVGEFLSTTFDMKRAFHISNNAFAIIFKDENELEEAKILIDNRFLKPWNLENIECNVAHNLIKISCPGDVENISEFHGVNNFLKQIVRGDAMTSYIEMTPELKDKYTRNLEVNHALNRALEENSIKIYFQPIYDCKRKAFTSIEVLARLIDPEIGFIPPDEFIAAAENNGTIVPLDLMILEKTCEFIAKEILPRKDKLDIATVQINISVLQCMQQNMDQVILDIIDKYQVPHEMIMLEITEHAAISAAELMEKHMRSLKEKGVCFALDDYGTGNSNCSYLIEYPFDKVKFDKTMVWAYFKTKTGKIILDGEMRTIHNLEIPIVAEGIELEEQLKAMEEMGVELIQGYYFSKPIPGDEVIEFLLREKAAQG